MRAPLALVTVLALAGCSSATGGTADPPVGKASPRSLSGITPPHLTVTHPAASDVAPGFVFVGEKGGKDRPSGPVIADNQGRIVWYHEVPHGLEKAPAYAAVRALDSDGHPLGDSATVKR